MINLFWTRVAPLTLSTSALIVFAGNYAGWPWWVSAVLGGWAGVVYGKVLDDMKKE